MNEGRTYHLAERSSRRSALNKEGLNVLKALNRSTEAYDVSATAGEVREDQGTEVVIRVMLSTAELHWSSGFSTALPLLLQALALARQHHLQALASETILHLAFTQLMLGVPEQALSVLHEAIEPFWPTAPSWTKAEP
ncbi:anaphase-promoting complex subunit 5-like [Larimichthys crocea]|uniref:anaphase-promoting complex subunit 5-like n=1 Tax=Larimichthys crocea TaxID=215358 RepID=UPI000F5F31CC|nr:anaphase-promoting complex subunit 5-like [Larimichthys crocea]